MPHTIPLAVASLAAALTFAVALVVGGLAPAAPVAADIERDDRRRPSRDADPPTVQIDTVYVAAPPAQETITVHKVIKTSGEDGSEHESEGRRLRWPTFDQAADRGSRASPRRDAGRPLGPFPRAPPRRARSSLAARVAGPGGRADPAGEEAAPRSGTAADRARPDRHGGRERPRQRVPRAVRRRDGGNRNDDGDDRRPCVRRSPSSTSPATCSSRPARRRHRRPSSSRRLRPSPAS